MPSSEEVKQLEGVSVAQHRFRLSFSTAEAAAQEAGTYGQLAVRNSRYKEKFQTLREKYDRVIAKQEEYHRDLEIAAAKIKKLQAENDLLLDAISLAAAHQPSLFAFPPPPPAVSEPPPVSLPHLAQPQPQPHSALFQTQNMAKDIPIPVDTNSGAPFPHSHSHSHSQRYVNGSGSGSSGNNGGPVPVPVQTNGTGASTGGGVLIPPPAEHPPRPSRQPSIEFIPHDAVPVPVNGNGRGAP